MSSNFPFLAIAKKYDVPYETVLAVAADQAITGSVGIDHVIKSAVSVERERRINIANMAPTFQHNLLGNS